MLQAIPKKREKREEDYPSFETAVAPSPDLSGKGIIACSPQMRAVLKLADQVASTDCIVMLSGESWVGKDVIARYMGCAGTKHLWDSQVGKDVIARYIHEKGSRAASPFIKVNCGAIPEALLESELFGYERGAFTGANREGKPGKFELAKDGTMFLDEVGDLPLSLQVKLLHVIEEREVMRVGGTVPRRFNVRIITATNRNLKEMVAVGKFREDLYFRLNVIPVHIPPLRERKEDIAPLVMFFKEKYEKKYNVRNRCSPELMKTFLDYDWPGNVRELENTIERIYVMIDHDKPVTPGMLVKYGLGLDFNRSSAHPAAPAVTVHRLTTLKEALAETEAQLLAMAMEKNKGLKEISQVLGVDQSTISRKLKRLREERGRVKVFSDGEGTWRES